MSSVLHAGLNDQSQLNETIKTKKVEDCDTFSEMEHRHGDPVASRDDAHIHKSIKYVVTRLAKSVYQSLIPQQNTQITKLRASCIREKPDFLVDITRNIMLAPLQELFLF